MPHNKNGFTLIELITILAMIGIAAAVVIPSMLDWRKQMVVSDTSRRIQGVFQEARLAAIEDNAVVVVQFTAGYDGGTQAFVDLDLSNTWDAGERIVATETMPTDVQLLRADFGSADTTYTSYTRLGLPSPGFSGYVMIGNRDADNFQRINLSSAGNVSVDKQVSVF